MNIRKISAILIAVMCLSLLGGCGSKEETSANNIEDMKSKYAEYVTLGEYKGLSYTPTDTEVTEEDIQADIDSLLSSNSTTEEVYDRVATLGDSVNIDFAGYVDGVQFDGGTASATDITLGSGTFIDDFEDQIAGHEPGDEFTVEVTFPEDYQSEDLAGKDAQFETKLNFITETILPTYDDALVASVTDYQTTDEFESAMYEEHSATNAENAEYNAKYDLMEQVLANATVSEYPEKELTDRIQKINDSMQETADANGIDLETFLSYYGYDSETFQEQVKSTVESYIEEKMIVVAIAAAEDITISEEEKEEEVTTLMEQYGATDKESFMSTYGYEESDFWYQALYTKVVDLVYSSAVAAE